MSAVLSDCGTYRYALWREWMTGEGTCLFVMLNPSTADASEDDPTIRRCIGFAQRWGYQRLAVGNLYAYRATDPKEMKGALRPIGEPLPLREVFDVLSAHSFVEHLGLTKAGAPKHPLPHHVSASLPCQLSNHELEQFARQNWKWSERLVTQITNALKEGAR